MSRIGKKPVQMPEKTEVTVSGSMVSVQGPLGVVTRTVHPYVKIEVTGRTALVSPLNETRLARALWGTYASHLTNMLRGVREPYRKKLILDGVGYKMAVTGKELTMQLGFSHPVKMAIPQGITAVVEKNELTLTGIDKEGLGQFAANVRAVKKPEPYKGKGFHYSDEVILRKQGKKAS